MWIICTKECDKYTKIQNMADDARVSPDTGAHSPRTVCVKFRDILATAFTWNVWKPILCGQGLSLLICGTAVTSNYLVQDYNANIPLTQNLCVYILLLVTYGTYFLLKKNEYGRSWLLQTLKEYWWKYLIISIADVLGNYLIVSAYQYTTLTSVQILDCFVILVVMVLSRFFLKSHFKIVHYIGVVVALTGVSCMIIADVLLGKGGSGSNPLVGDLMVLGAATCYGISNVGIEYFVNHRPLGYLEIPAMFGLYGTTINGILVASLERHALESVKWSTVAVLLILSYAIFMFLLYSLMPITMRIGSAVIVNLSLLTADLYALFVGIFLFNYELSALYFISFGVICLSLIIYNSRPPENQNDNESTEDVVLTASSTSQNTSTVDECTPVVMYPEEEIFGTWFGSEE